MHQQPWLDWGASSGTEEEAVVEDARSLPSTISQTSPLVKKKVESTRDVVQEASKTTNPVRVCALVKRPSFLSAHTLPRFRCQRVYVRSDQRKHLGFSHGHLHAQHS